MIEKYILGFAILCGIHAIVNSSSGDSTGSYESFQNDSDIGAPSNLKVEMNLGRRGKRQLHITWDEPKYGDLSYYILYFRTVGQWSPLSGRLDIPTYDWRLFSFGAKYYFMVTAYTEYGTSKNSHAVVFETGDPVYHMHVSSSAISYSSSVVLVAVAVLSFKWLI